MQKEIKLVVLGLLLAGLTSCGGGGTDGGADEGGPSISVGSLAFFDLDQDVTALEVSNTATVTINARTGTGAGLDRLSVTCDTEEGLALITPSSGRQLTNDSGDLTVEVGCEAPGVFQFGCRAGLGLNTGTARVYSTMRCTGNIPAGFSGFPSAGGRTLGGSSGGSGSDGNVDTIDAVRVQDIEIYDVGDEPTFNVDVFQVGDCDTTDTEITPEPFTTNLFTALVVNQSNQAIRFKSYTITVPEAQGLGRSTYISPKFNLFTQLLVQPTDDPTATSALTGQFTTFDNDGYKAFVGASENIPGNFNSSIDEVLGVRNVTFTLYGQNQDGEQVIIAFKKAIDFNRFDNCDS